MGNDCFPNYWCPWLMWLKIKISQNSSLMLSLCFWERWKKCHFCHRFQNWFNFKLPKPFFEKFNLISTVLLVRVINKYQIESISIKILSRIQWMDWKLPNSSAREWDIRTFGVCHYPTFSGVDWLCIILWILHEKSSSHLHFSCVLLFCFGSRYSTGGDLDEFADFNSAFSNNSSVIAAPTPAPIPSFPVSTNTSTSKISSSCLIGVSL